MLDLIKLSLRYKNNLFDKELEMYIAACKSELVLADIKESLIVETDLNIVNVFCAYCKWQLNYQNKGENWEKIYTGLKISLAMNSNYIES